MDLEKSHDRLPLKKKIIKNCRSCIWVITLGMLVSVWVHWVFLTAFLRLCQSHFRWISGSIKCIVSCLFSCLWYSGTRYQEANEVGEVSSMYGLEVVSLLFKRCSDGTIKMHLHHAVNPFDWEINWVTGRLKLWVLVVEMSFLQSVARLILYDRVRNPTIQGRFGPEQLLLHFQGCPQFSSC